MHRLTTLVMLGLSLLMGRTSAYAFTEGQAETLVVTQDQTMVLDSDQRPTQLTLEVSPSATFTLQGAAHLITPELICKGGGKVVLEPGAEAASYRYFRWIPLSRPSAGNNADGVALDEVVLYQGDTQISWSGCTVTATHTSGSHAATKLIDGSITGNDTKWYYGGNPNLTQGTVYVQFVFANAVSFDSYALAMADQNGRNPMSWRWTASKDGTTWITLDERSYSQSEVLSWPTHAYQPKISFATPVVSGGSMAVTLGAETTLQTGMELGPITAEDSAKIMLNLSALTLTDGKKLLTFAQPTQAVVTSTGANASAAVAVRTKEGVVLKSTPRDDEFAACIRVPGCPTTSWEQTLPFKLFAPGRAPIGCTATQVAQAMKLWQWPRRTNSITSRDTSGSSTSTAFLDGRLPLDWALPDKNATGLSQRTQMDMARDSFAAAIIRNMNFESGNDLGAGSGSAASIYPNSFVHYGYQPMKRWARSDKTTGGANYNPGELVAPATLKQKYYDCIVTAQAPALVEVPSHSVVGMAWAKDAIGREFAGLNFGWYGADLYWTPFDRPYNTADTARNGVILQFCGPFIPRARADIDPLDVVSASDIDLTWLLPPRYAMDVTQTLVTATPMSDETSDVIEPLTESPTQGTLEGDVSFVTPSGDSGPSLRVDPTGYALYELNARVRLTRESMLTLDTRRMFTGAGSSVNGPRVYVQLSEHGESWTDLIALDYTSNGSDSGWQGNSKKLSPYAGSTMRVRILVLNPNAIASTSTTGETQRGVFIRNLKLASVSLPDSANAKTFTVQGAAQRCALTGLTAGRTYQIAVLPQSSSRQFAPATIVTRIAGEGLDFLPPTSQSVASAGINFASSPTNWSYTGSNAWTSYNYLSKNPTTGGYYYRTVLQSPGANVSYGEDLNLNLSNYHFTAESKLTITFCISPEEGMGQGDKYTISIGGQTLVANEVIPNEAYGSNAIYSKTYDIPESFSGMSAEIVVNFDSGSEHKTNTTLVCLDSVMLTNVEQVVESEEPSVRRTLQADAAPVIRGFREVEGGVRAHTGTAFSVIGDDDQTANEDLALTVTTSRPDILPASAFEIVYNASDKMWKVTLKSVPDSANAYGYLLTFCLTDGAGNASYKQAMLTYDALPDNIGGGYRWRLK